MVNFARAYKIVLEKYREQYGSANELAKSSDVSAAVYSNYPNEKQDVTTNSLAKMLEVLPEELRTEFFLILLESGGEGEGLGSPLERAAAILEKVSDEEYLGFAMAIVIEVFSYARRSVAPDSDKGFYMTAVAQLISKVSEHELPSLLEMVASEFRRSTTAAQVSKTPAPASNSNSKSRKRTKTSAKPGSQ